MAAWDDQVLVYEDSIQNIADAIREKNGETRKYYPSEMAEAIEELGGVDEIEQYLNSTITKCIDSEGTVEVIEQYAFYSCRSLSQISFPACTSIGNSAFFYCSALTEAIFPACTSIGSYAFYSCYSLSAAYFLASSVATLGNPGVFYSTPMSESSYLGYYGSIYVPQSLLASYKVATNWSVYSNRLVGV